MIRILTIKHHGIEPRQNLCYYSLIDFLKFLSLKNLLTERQERIFRTRIQQYILKAMSAGIKDDWISETDVPLILDFNEWFIHYLKWDTFSRWLPLRVQYDQDVWKILREIDYNEGVLYPEEFIMLFSEHEIVIPAKDYTIKERPAKEDIPKYNPFTRDK